MPFAFAEAVPKEDFKTLKSNFSELTEKFDALALEKTKLAEELEQNDEKLKASDLKLGELEGTILALQDDLDDLSKGSDVFNKELLRKDCSSLLRYSLCYQMGLSTFNYFGHCRPSRL